MNCVVVYHTYINIVSSLIRFFYVYLTRSVKGQSTEAEQEDSLQKLLLAEGGAADVRTKQNLPDINVRQFFYRSIFLNKFFFHR